MPILYRLFVLCFLLSLGMGCSRSEFYGEAPSGGGGGGVLETRGLVVSVEKHPEPALILSNEGTTRLYNVDVYIEFRSLDQSRLSFFVRHLDSIDPSDTPTRFLVPLPADFKSSNLVVMWQAPFSERLVYQGNVVEGGQGLQLLNVIKQAVGNNLNFDIRNLRPNKGLEGAKVSLNIDIKLTEPSGFNLDQQTLANAYTLALGDEIAVSSNFTVSDLNKVLARQAVFSCDFSWKENFQMGLFNLF